MNRFLFVLPLLLCGAAWAQPDPDAVGMGANPPEQPAFNAQPAFKADTPENGARKFVADFNGNLEMSFASNVVGARVGFYGPDDWEWAFNNLFQLRALKNSRVDAVKVEEAGENEAAVSVTIHQERRGGGAGQRSAPQTVQLRLHRDTNVAAPIIGLAPVLWRVEAPPIEEILAKPIEDTPPFELAASLTLRNPLWLPFIRTQRGMGQLKQLGLGALQFVEDYDEFYAFDDEAHERALRPYLKTDSFYTIAGTKDDKWHFNDNLSSLPMAQVAEPARTVLFYDGSAPDSDHLNFRFGDKTLICFADGHCKAALKAELKDLLWKP